MASPTVPMMADCVSAPPASPAAMPLLRLKSFAQISTVISAVTARNTAIAISRSVLRLSELKNSGPEYVAHRVDEHGEHHGLHAVVDLHAELTDHHRRKQRPAHAAQLKLAEVDLPNEITRRER
jgi:hypothetical protein